MAKRGNSALPVSALRHRVCSVLVRRAAWLGPGGGRKHPVAEDLVKALDQVKLPVFFRLASWSAACGGDSVCPDGGNGSPCPLPGLAVEVLVPGGRLGGRAMACPLLEVNALSRPER